MKTAIYIEDGTVQLVITPENDFEKNAISSFENKPLDAKIFSGAFYDCRGGWIRQRSYYMDRFSQWGTTDNDKSLILRISEQEPIDEKLP